MKAFAENQVGKAERENAELKRIVLAIEGYAADHDEYPKNLDDLEQNGYRSGKNIDIMRLDGNGTEVHIHLMHDSSIHYFHYLYPADDTSERRKAKG